jgi:hypothetical protein
MNILLWALQIVLAFWNLTGGFYTAFHYDQLKSTVANDLPGPVWVLLGVLQIIFAIGLVLPGFTGTLPKLIPVSAIGIVVYSLLGCVLFAKYSGFPGVLWGVIPAVLAGFVAYGRM